MGELDTTPFFEAMKQKYSEEMAEEKASYLCSVWEEYLKDPEWHPFKITPTAEGKHKVHNCQIHRSKISCFPVLPMAASMAEWHGSKGSLHFKILMVHGTSEIHTS